MVVSILLVFLLCGCTNLVRGNLYAHIVQPYSRDFDNTPVGTKKCILTSYRLREPATRVGLSAEWDTRTIRREAARAGITNMYYADLSTISIGWGVYRRRGLIIYGD